MNPAVFLTGILPMLALAASANETTDLASLPLAPPSVRAQGDWLITKPEAIARARRTENPNEIELSNGLIRRVWRIVPNAACVSFDNLMTGESILRGVKPEAIVEIDGKRARRVGECMHARGGTTVPNFSIDYLRYHNDKPNLLATRTADATASS